MAARLAHWMSLLEGFDLATFSTMAMVMALALALAMFINWVAQKRQPGTAYWALAFGFNALGSVLFHYQSKNIPTWIWSVVGSTCLLSAWSLAYLGACRFLNAFILSWPWVAGSVVVHLMLMIWFTVVEPNGVVRALVYLATNSFMLGAIGLLLFRTGRGNREPGVSYFMAGLCVFHVLYNIARIGFVLAGKVTFDFAKMPPAMAASFMEGVILSLLMATSVIIMISQRIRHQLELLALRDDLSGLGNRRHFMESVHRETDRVRRYQRPLALIVLDIDHFKQINDSHGHPCGDAVIQRVSQIVRSELRNQDIICRIGGEEFAILMPETNKTSAFAIAERLRSQMMLATVDIGKGEVTFTASFEVTEFVPNEDDIVGLLQRVDHHLYQAKNLGRNRVYVTATEPDLALILPLYR